MTHLLSTPTDTFAMHGVSFNSFCASASGADELAGWRADFAPHTPGQAHTMSREELLLVLRGRLDVEVGEERFEATPGDAVRVPARTRFCVSNASPEPAQAWVVTRLGMTATMEAGAELLAPPWAQ